MRLIICSRVTWKKIWRLGHAQHLTGLLLALRHTLDAARKISEK